MIAYHDCAFSWEFVNAFHLHVCSCLYTHTYVSPSDWSTPFVVFPNYCSTSDNLFSLACCFLRPLSCSNQDGLLLGSAVKILQGASHCHHLGLPSLAFLSSLFPEYFTVFLSHLLRCSTASNSFLKMSTQKVHVLKCLKMSLFFSQTLFVGIEI